MSSRDQAGLVPSSTKAPPAPYCAECNRFVNKGGRITNDSRAGRPKGKDCNDFPICLIATHLAVNCFGNESTLHVTLEN